MNPTGLAASVSRRGAFSCGRRLLLGSVLIASALGCDLRSEPPLISVYIPDIKVSILLPQGWRSEATRQSGFYLQSFTGMSVDVPDRPGIRVQIMVGNMPDLQTIDDLAERYIADAEELTAGSYALANHAGRTWQFGSQAKEERGRLMMTDVDGVLYGLYALGEARTVLAYDGILDQMWDSFSLEQPQYFDHYEAPGGDPMIAHPRSWPRTAAAAKPGESLFVGFRSAPLAVEEDGTTVHATFEITVNAVEPEMTVERFYELRTELLGDSYRLLSHEALPDGSISTLYRVETQLADYLERTVYSVEGGKSMIYKFNARVPIYRAIEGWIDDIVVASMALQVTG